MQYQPMGLGPQVTAPAQTQPMALDKAQWAPMEATAFNANKVTEFVPKGKMVATKEQFPDLADAFGDDEPKSKKGGKKGKKKTVVKASVTIEEEADDGTPWKGKPAAFFSMNVSNKPLNDPTNPNNFEMNDEQWKFIFKHYPEFGASPYDMMVWLFGESSRKEELDASYNKPTNGGIGMDSDEEVSSNKFEKQFVKKQGNKKDTRANTELAREAQLKKLQELKEKAGPGKTEA